jgi:hypothetical protein
MTLAEFEYERTVRPCVGCGHTGLVTQHNINNNGLLVICPTCGSKRPWGALLYLKQNIHKRPSRSPLPNGETLDSIWEKFGNRCVLCSAPKAFLLSIDIGRTVHHVAPYAQARHDRPLVPICNLCHALANERQGLSAFLQRVVLKALEERLYQPANQRDHPTDGASMLPFPAPPSTRRRGT